MSPPAQPTVAMIAATATAAPRPVRRDRRGRRGPRGWRWAGRRDTKNDLLQAVVPGLLCRMRHRPVTPGRRKAALCSELPGCVQAPATCGRLGPDGSRYWTLVI